MINKPLKQSVQLNTYTLYIHYPWCIKKCPYCDFNSHQQLTDQDLENQYIKALVKDLKTDLSLVEGRELNSIFFGGGTPSLMSVKNIEYLLNAIAQYCHLADEVEITLEANPGSLEKGRFLGYHQAGINRLSIGIQSFDNQKLQALGRVHSQKEAENAIKSAIDAGFQQLNLDLMYALPNQNTKQALVDLKKAASFVPSHLSWYQLTIEPNTYFHSKPPILPEQDELWDIQQEGQQVLSSLGYKQYEISAYSQVGSKCQHNLNYWSFGDYLGIGAGAQGKISQSDCIIRRWKKKNPVDYISPKKKIEAKESILTQQDLILEFMMNGLRLNQGIEKNRFIETTGLPLSVLDKPVNKAIEWGLLEKNQQYFKPTRQGQNFLNDLLQLFS